ncbi:hypothetical protein BN168_240006 [Clostridioides difficile CD002]|nr:hypothetical protein BN168_240006 [Clostridioides difficile CD002]
MYLFKYRIFFLTSKYSNIAKMPNLSKKNAVILKKDYNTFMKIKK